MRQPKHDLLSRNLQSTPQPTLEAFLTILPLQTCTTGWSLLLPRLSNPYASHVAAQTSRLSSRAIISLNVDKRPFVLARHTELRLTQPSEASIMQVTVPSYMPTDITVDRLDIWNNDGNHNLSTHKTAVSPMFGTLMQSNADNFLFRTYKKQSKKKTALNIQCTCHTVINTLFMLTNILDPLSTLVGPPPSYEQQPRRPFTHDAIPI